MAELIGGAAVGTVFGELARTCMDVKDKAVMFRPTMHQLEDTLESLEPVIKDIELYNHELNRPQSEIESLIRLMEKGKSLLSKCSRIRGWYDLRRVSHQTKLVGLEKSLRRFLNVNLQAQMARDQKQMLLLFRSTILGPDNHGHQDLTVGMTVSQIGHAKRGGMTLELVGGAAFGAVFGELVGALMEVNDKAVMFRLKMDQLESALNSLAPEIKHIELYNRELINSRKSEMESLIRIETITITVLLEINVQSHGPGCCQDFIIQRQIEVEAVVKDGYITPVGGTLPRDLWELLNRLSKPVCKVQRLMASSITRKYKYTVVRYQDPSILGDSGASRISKYDEIESNIEQLALPAAADETSTANRSIVSSSSASDLNSLRISEYVETNENPLSEGGNPRHIERSTHSPAAADETSAAELENHENEYEKRITHSDSEAPVQLQPLHILEGTATSSRQKLITEIPSSGISETGFPNILCHCGTRAAMRILEYERNKDRLYYCCERRNCSFFEWGIPPAASGEVGTSDESKKMIAQGELGTTGRQQKLLIPAIVFLSCFNLLFSFFILIYK